MKASDIKVAVVDGIATLTLAAPQRRNALTTDMAASLIEACDQVDRSDVGAVVLRAEGPSFCAGADRALLSRAASERSSDSREPLTLIYRAFARLRDLRAPSIAAVRGHAVGAGFNLALSTDLRIVATDARLASGFFALGLHPGGGHLSMIGALAGAEAATAIGVFSETITGERAWQLGIAWEHVAAEHVDERAKELARKVAHDSELARAVVASLRQELGPPRLNWSDASDLEGERQWWSLGRPSITARLEARARERGSP